MANDIVSPVRWVGGKRALADQIMTRVPKTIRTYVEPFLGGGSIFIEILKQNLAESYVVADINKHVIQMWHDIRNDYENLVGELHVLKKIYDSETDMESKRQVYYGLREALNEKQSHECKSVSTYDQSAVFMTLNKTAFNALVRYNGKGQFNSAFGKREKVAMEFDNLDRLHNLLNQVDVMFVEGDFTKAEDVMQCRGGWQAGDFAYLDPPYHVLSNRKVDDKTYSKEGFTDEDEKRMRGFCDRIVEAGGAFLMSNHECPEILEYFEGYLFEKVNCYKCFTGKASSRIETKEILLGNLITTSEE